MGRAGAGTGAASRALDPLRSRLRPAGSQRTYLSISHLRSLHIELVALLYSAGATSAAPSPSSSGDTPTLSVRQNRRLVEILRSIAELVRDDAGGWGLHLFQNYQFFQARRSVLRACLRQRASCTPLYPGGGSVQELVVLLGSTMQCEFRGISVLFPCMRALAYVARTRLADYLSYTCVSKRAACGTHCLGEPGGNPWQPLHVLAGWTFTSTAVGTSLGPKCAPDPAARLFLYGTRLFVTR